MFTNILSDQKSYFATGATLPIKSRISALKRLYHAIKTHETEICNALQQDLKKSECESYMCEIGLIYAEIRYMIKHVKKFAKQKKVRTPLAQFPAKSFSLPSPYGCVLVMSPWNYPFLLTIEPLVDAVAAGNCVIVKPSAYAPATSEIVKKLLKSTFPAKFITVVTGGREENDALLDLPFDKIFFTGSIAVGKEVMRRAAERLIPVTLELGGKSPCIVDETANIPLAARRIVFGKFLNCGQTCVAPDYILVHRSIESTFLQALKTEIERQFGAAPLKNQSYGKIINLKHFNRLSHLLDREKLYCGGETDIQNLQIAPTVLRNIDFSDPIMQEEIFGPILPVIAYDDFKSEMQAINKRNKPLALYLFSSDKKKIKEATTLCAFGGGCINDTIIHLATSEMAFGGIGESGMGAYHGKDGFDCFTHYKSIVNKSTKIDLPMRYQPYTKKHKKMIRKFLK